MAERPALILESRQRLAGPPPGITETVLDAGRGTAGGTSADAAFPYRYEGLRLLLASGGRLFLVPERWTAESRTTVVPYGAEVRIQLIPVR